MLKEEWIKENSLSERRHDYPATLQHLQIRLHEEYIVECRDFLRKEDLRNSIIAWRWGCLGETMKYFKQSLEILDFLREVAKNDPEDCGFNVALSWLSSRRIIR
jgi:hypothetical protein